ncbi:P-type conjugative transfer protein TrbL [Shewanella sp. 4t3-1-2LB]|uniref:P-type conjugative transfer protein TrbL n=1 Tax=Shewanella sp. 4t3-1-2LB TaxID=2817682 RepID=UPI001A99F7DA|nr:P-type conjugative transfer protein TrbL [Shewanella sp. 4t3-1-2LB]MBO1272896.1 P-type conjugative transfer protein TrbL [Shewanella sp. 4t3-1-2LB]
MRLVFFLLLLIAIPSYAAAVPQGQGVPESGAINELLLTFENAANVWPAIIRQYVTWLFWALVGISWAWHFLWMAFKGDSIVELLAELTRRSLLIGFFYWLVIDGTSIASSIVEGFMFIGNKISGQYIHPGSVFDIGFSLASEIIKKLSWTSMGDSIGFILAGLGILIIMAFITLEMVLIIIQYYIMLNLGVVMMGFLGHEWSREYGINYFRLMLGLGVKFLIMQMIVSLSLSILQTWLQTSDLTWTQVLLILPTLLVIWGLVREVPAQAASLISGVTSPTSGDAIAGAMQAAATTAAAVGAAYVGAQTVAGASLGGSANAMDLMRNAWNQASGLGGDNDPATSSLPDADSGSGTTGSGSGDNLPRSHGNDSDYQGAISSGSGSGSGSEISSPSAPKSKLAIAAKAAKIAGGAVAGEVANTAKNAFLNGLKRPIEGRSASFLGRAASSIGNSGPTSSSAFNSGMANSSATMMNDANSSGWFTQSGGYDALSHEHQMAARDAHSRWRAESQTHTFNLREYVTYTQNMNTPPR